MLCPRCPNLLWTCGTVNFFFFFFACLRAHLLHPPISNPGSTHACSKTLNYASCGLVHQSFTIKFKHLHPGPLHKSPKEPFTNFSFSFQLFISAFQLYFSSFSSYPPPADQPKECDTCLDVSFLHNHVCDHPADH